ncbi:hypothetical protein HanPI659440_Chr06g0234981 [Helianthus annuus]|nr:hypothetical protein HanPI659440_Chr06g0234981 [Helianthus annuus]
MFRRCNRCLKGRIETTPLHLAKTLIDSSTTTSAGFSFPLYWFCFLFLVIYELSHHSCCKLMVMNLFFFMLLLCNVMLSLVLCLGP